MAYKLITTKLDGHIVCALLDEKERVIEVHPFKDTLSTKVGNIYVGKVQMIKKNIHSAFINIGEDDNVFVSLKDSAHYHYANKLSQSSELVMGDEILVQIQKDAHKTKLAKGITDFCLTGKYTVLTTDQPAVFVSSKITNDQKRIGLKKMLKKHITEQYGFIGRTNCQDASKEVIVSEIEALAAQYNHLMEILPYRSCGQKLLSQGAPHMTLLKDFYDHEIESFYYDDEVLYAQAKDYVASNFDDMTEKFILTEEPIDLATKLNLRKKIEKLLQTKVWLKSGASIIIEPTEALTAIDVNTEKTLSKKNQEETITKTNLEAANEIIYQIRARNLSGIIIVDFIDMNAKEDKEKLLTVLRKLALNDPQKTTIVDMTKLGLVEITRKKRKPPLKEQW